MASTSNRGFLSNGSPSGPQNKRMNGKRENNNNLSEQIYPEKKHRNIHNQRHINSTNLFQVICKLSVSVGSTGY